jgi:hypothetical protein
LGALNLQFDPDKPFNGLPLLPPSIELESKTEIEAMILGTRSVDITH